MNKLSLVFTFFAATTLHAGVSTDVSRLLDSYVVAKADTHIPMFTDEQVKDTPYTIQVASYINERDAVSHVEELKLQEKDVMYFPAFVRGQVWFKVCVGRFDKKDGAENYRRQFTKRMDEPFAIVISLLDRPANETPGRTDMPTKNVAKADTGRDPASLAKKSSTTLPVEVTENAHHDDGMQVKLMPKKMAKAVKVAAAVHGHDEAQGPATTVMRGGDAFYSLQVGAFQSEEMAKQSLAKLPVNEHQPYYKMAVVNGQTWYRLLIGRFSTRKEAEDFQKSFTEQARGAESFVRRVTASE